MRNLLLLISLVVLGVIYAKKTDQENYDKRLQTEGADENSRTAEDLATTINLLRKKSFHNLKRITAPRAIEETTHPSGNLESGSEKEESSATTESPSNSLQSKNFGSSNKRNKTKTDRNFGQKEEVLEFTGDNTGTTAGTHVEPPVSNRDRSVGIPDRVESEFPQKNPENNNQKIHQLGRVKSTTRPVPEAFPVEKNDQVAVKGLTASAKKRATTTRPTTTTEPATTEFFYILTGIPPDDSDFRNPNTKTPPPTPNPPLTPVANPHIIPSTEGAETEDDNNSEDDRKPLSSKGNDRKPSQSNSEFHAETFVIPITEPPRNKLSNKHKTTPLPQVDEAQPGFHILTGTPPDDGEESENKGTSPAESAEETARTLRTTKATLPPSETVGEKAKGLRLLKSTPPPDDTDEDRPAGFHVLTGIPPEDFDSVTRNEAKVTRTPEQPKKINPTAPAEEEDRTDEDEITTVSSIDKKDQKSGTAGPVVATTSGRSRQQPKKPADDDESRLVATDAEFGKAVNAKFNDIIRNLSASGLLTEKDLLSERVIKNISDTFAEFIQQSLISRDSAEPLGKLEQDLILVENADKVISQFKASRSHPIRMEKRQHGVIDFDRLGQTGSETGASFESTQSGKTERESTTLSPPIQTPGNLVGPRGGRNRTRIQVLPVPPFEEAPNGAPAISPSSRTSLTVTAGSLEQTEFSGEPISKSSETNSEFDSQKKHFESNTGLPSLSPTSGTLGKSTLRSIIVTESSSETSKESTNTVDTTRTSRLFSGSSTDDTGSSEASHRESLPPEFIEKKHQTPLVHFQVGAEASTLQPLKTNDNGVVTTTFPLEETLKNNSKSTNNKYKSRIDGVAETSTASHQVVTHFITRPPLDLKGKGKKEQISSETESSAIGSSETFPGPPNWSAKDENSFLAGYRTKPVPVESRERVDGNASDVNNSSESSETDVTPNITSSTKVEGTGLVLLTASATSTSSSGSSESSRSILYETSSFNKFSTQRSTSNIVVTPPPIQIVDEGNTTSDGNTTSNVTDTTPPPGFSPTSSSTSSSLLSGAVSSASNESGLETTVAQSGFNNTLIITPLFSFETKTAGSDISPVTTPVTLFGSPVVSNGTQGEVISSGTLSSATATGASVNRSGSPVPEPVPEWIKSTEGPKTNESTGVPEPEWTKSTVKNMWNESSGVPEPEPTKKPVQGVPPGSSETVTPSRPANPAIVTWSLKLELDWDTNFNDKSTWQYKKLSKKIESPLTKIFTDLLKEKFISLLIKRFSAGSVVVNGELQVTEKVDTAKLEDSFRASLREQSFKIDDLEVDPTSIKVEGLGDTAPQTAAKPIAGNAGGGVPGYVIGIIVAVIILALVILAVALYLRRYRQQSRDDNYTPNQDANGKNWHQQQTQPRAATNGRDPYAGVNMYEMNDVPAHAHVNQGYQGDGRTNGYHGSNRNVAETQHSLDAAQVDFEEEISSRH